MEWKDLQPIAIIIAAIIAAVTSSVTLWKLQNKKRSDDEDLKALGHSLDKRLKEFEITLAKTNSYLNEKGKNNATKEDVEEITRKVETVRSEFAETTEILKWQLSKRVNLHKLQAEKEFEVYTKMWNMLTELRLAFEEHRPLLDMQPLGTNWSDLWDKRHQSITDSRNQLLIEVEKQKPFYSKDLYFELRKLLGITLNEILDFENSFDTKGKITHDSKSIGKENLDQFTESLEIICEFIRIRITES